MRQLSAQCCISGGGPAGLMVGYLLARQGVNVIVLEKHADFLRDFRGDTVHPSTLNLFEELGLLDELLRRPHQKTEQVSLVVSGRELVIADFKAIPGRNKYMAMMPQWDFLDVLADAASMLPNFRLMMSTRADTLIEETGSVKGITAHNSETALEIRAPLTIVADGRASELRSASGLPLEELGAPIDVFWFRLTRTDGAETDSFGELGAGGFLVQLNRGDYWQCALPFPKGAADTIRAQGLEAFRQRVAGIAPSLKDAAQEIVDWDQVKLLNVQVNRLTKWWRDGLLCIGDAAHAMSPVGGVGINLAIQDAVAAARMLGPSLKLGNAPLEVLADIQKRREWPTKMTQSAQVFAHSRVLVPVLTQKAEPDIPWFFKLLNAVPPLRGLPARALGLGVRPEHWAELD